MGSRGRLNGQLYVQSDHWPEMAPESLPGSELVVKINKITSAFSFFCNKQTTVKCLMEHYSISILGGPQEVTRKSESRPWSLLLCPALI